MGASLVAQMVRSLSATQETWISSLGQEDPLEKRLATHFSILAQRIPWTKDPVGLQSMRLQRFRHNQVTKFGFPGGSDGKESACNSGNPGSIPGWGRSLEKGMATHSSILAWRNSWTKEPSGLQFIRSDTTERRHVTK